MRSIREENDELQLTAVRLGKKTIKHLLRTAEVNERNLSEEIRYRLRRDIEKNG